ncbi:MAG: hypothetical protein AAGF48_06730 [Pseudomonadota bacterium]
MNEDRDDLPRLTPKQEAFVKGLLKGKTATDAYKAAYDVAGMAHRTIWAEASRLRAHPKVSTWLRHFQRIGMDEARITLKDHLAELARGRELAFELGQASAAVQAEHYRGKAVGLYEDCLSLSANMSDADLLTAIEDLLGKEIARAIGLQLGVPTEATEVATEDLG